MRPTTSVRKNPRKKLPPRNTPDSFCRRFTPPKSIAALLGRYFSLWETYLENFISRPNVILTFRQRRCTNRGRNFVRSKRRPHYMSRAPLLIFCVLTIRKHLLMKRFERSGRGQEPSRGHKFSILENFLSIRDFTSAMRLHFRSDLVGVTLVGARPLHLACARPRCRLKAPLGLSLLRCASQARSNPKPCSSFVPSGTNATACRALHNFTEELSNRQEVQ